MYAAFYKHVAPLGLNTGLYNPVNPHYVLRYHMSPLWGFRCLVYAACYKHVAPLGLNTAASPPVFWFSASPRRCVKYSFRITHYVSPYYVITCRPSGALRYLVYAACYKHAAPLGLNAPVHLSSSGLGNPTPTGSTVGWRLGFLSAPSAESVKKGIDKSIKP